MRYNSYVYPYTPFNDLSNKTIRWELAEPRSVSVSDVKNILASQPKLKPAISGQTEAERILSIFLDDEVLFGPAEFITDLRQEWLDALGNFIAKGEPIQFTLLGFPFKVPVKLKTNRAMPDMGELLILHRLDALARAIHDNYPAGAIITIFTEGAFGPYVGVAEQTARAYAVALNNLVEVFGFTKYIKVRALSEMENSIPDFGQILTQKQSELSAKLATADESFRKKYDGAYSSIYRIVATDMYPDEAVMDAYNESLDERQLSATAYEIRRDIEHRAKDAVIKYHAYLEVRDDIRFLQKTVPDALALTVSPKPKRLGIIPINRACERLPYHGVAVLDEKQNLFTIEYLVDIKRKPQQFIPVKLAGDTDQAPFYYLI